MNINVAFCFDENLVKQVRVSVASLLDAGKDPDVHYHIYCVCTKEAASVRGELEKIVAARDGQSQIRLVDIENPYKRMKYGAFRQVRTCVWNCRISCRIRTGFCIWTLIRWSGEA